MKRFTFPYTISFGKQDSVGDSIIYTLSDTDAERLIRSAEEGGRNRLGEDEFISDICALVYQAIDIKLTKQLLKDPIPVRDALSWKDSFDPDQPITTEHVQEYLNELMITAYYPRKLQLLEAKAPTETTPAHYEIMDEQQAAEQAKNDSYGNNVIILTDEGKTLYHVPKKYKGSITIPASVRKIRSSFGDGAISFRKLITEIIIENGLPEIKEWNFTGCSGLKHLVIPGSVKAIGHKAFAGCSSLKQVVLPEGLESLYYSSFEHCYKLESITIPSTLKIMYKLDIRNIYFMGMDTDITEELGCNWLRTILHVLPGSKAEKYAIAHEIRYVLMNDKK